MGWTCSADRFGGGILVAVLKDETVPLLRSQDIVTVRQLVRNWTSELGFSLVDQTKLVTAASELARNTIQHGGGGSARVECVNNGTRRGVRLTFQDHGPGIGDIDLAMKDGYSTTGGMGLGLSGSKRLTNEFEIESRAGAGTRVTIARWKWWSLNQT
jgi:serine/threonine-protein kinase RsbT